MSRRRKNTTWNIKVRESNIDFKLEIKNKPKDFPNERWNSKSEGLCEESKKLIALETEPEATLKTIRHLKLPETKCFRWSESGIEFPSWMVSR